MHAADVGFCIALPDGGDDSGNDRDTADEWIQRELQENSECMLRFHKLHVREITLAHIATALPGRVEVVTADRQLRSIAHRFKAKTINPSKFWRCFARPSLRLALSVIVCLASTVKPHSSCVLRLRLNLAGAICLG